MSGPVDVLAVMDAASLTIGKLGDIGRSRTTKIDEARAAVAELIEAVHDERVVWENTDKHPGWVGRVQAAKDRTNAALARIGGAA